MGSRGKEILLLVLAVVALAFAVYTFRPKQPSQPASTAVATAQPGDAAVLSAQQPEGDASQLAAAGAEGGGPGAAARNPFAAPGEGGASGEAPSELAGALAAASGPSQADQTGTPPAPDAALPGAGEEGTTAGSLKLTGIVAGPKPLALVRQGDQRYFLKVGDRIGDHYRVRAIRKAEVELVSEADTIILRMGGRQ